MRGRIGMGAGGRDRLRHVDRALVRFGWPQLDLASGVVVGYSPFGVPPVVGGVLVEETDPLYAAGPPAFLPPKA